MWRRPRVSQKQQQQRKVRLFTHTVNVSPTINCCNVHIPT